MKVLLVNLPFYEDDFHEKDFFVRINSAPLFPVGIASIASYIRDRGYEVELLDIYAEQINNKEVLDVLKEKEFDVIGISALVNQYAYLRWFAGELKKIKDVPVVLGNGMGTASYEVILRNVPEVDICVIGEGEQTFLELLENSFGNLDSIPGIAYRKNGEIVNNPYKSLIINIDELPYPSYDLLNMDKYLNARFYDTGVFNIRSKYRLSRTIPIITGRGCPYSCKFCGKVIPNSRVRTISNVIKEIKYLKDIYDITGVHFMDELLVVNKKRTLELCDEMKKMNLIWDCQGRINTVDRELLATMKESGCIAIGFGIESGSQKILDNMKKNITVEQIRNAMNAAREVGLPVKTQLIFGYPGENIQTLDETVKLLKDVRDPGRRFLYICPLPGTELYEEALEQDLIGDEEQYLYKIRDCFDRRIPGINFTEFPKDKIIDIMRYYYNKMVFNHLLYLLRHPLLFIKKIVGFKLGAMGLAELLARSLLYVFKKNPALG